MADYIPIKTLEGDGQFDAYVATPDSAPKAAIIVIQEIFGVNEGIDPHIELDADIPEQMQQALAYIPRFNQDQGVRDIEATIRAARAMLEGPAKVGVVGYCLGGRVAFMTACRTDGDAFVGYYGVGIDGLLGEQHAIGKPTMLHIPTHDGFVPADVQAKMHDGLKDNRHVTLHDYEGLDHGFAAEMGDRRVEEAAQLADRRTADFFAQALV
jgi:carboxymethylenebutenolidase